LKVAFEINLRKKLARTEHVLIVKVYFERRKIAKVFMTHVQDLFWKSLSKATFEKKLSGVSLPLVKVASSSVIFNYQLTNILSNTAIGWCSTSCHHHGDAAEL